MNQTNIIDLDAYRAQPQPAQQQTSSDELTIAIQNLIRDLRESNRG